MTNIISLMPQFKAMKIAENTIVKLHSNIFNYRRLIEKSAVKINLSDAGKKDEMMKSIYNLVKHHLSRELVKAGVTPVSERSLQTHCERLIAEILKP